MSFWIFGKFNPNKFFAYTKKIQRKNINKNTKHIISELKETLKERAKTGYNSLFFYYADYELRYDDVYDYQRIKEWFYSIYNTDPNRFEISINNFGIKLSWKDDLT